MVLLHGVLNVIVHEAKDLTSTRRIQAVGIIKRYVCCGMLPELAGSCDPYFCLDVGTARRLRTTIIQGTHNPLWNERFEVYVCDEAEELRIEVKDADVIGADFLGQAVIPVAEVAGGQRFDEWLPLTDMQGRPMHGKGKDMGERRPSLVHITIQYQPVSAHMAQTRKSHRWCEVPRTYFPQRSGNLVTLYHDAACCPGPVDGIQLAGGGLYSEHSCWDDISDAIRGAERFIWITGWSVWADTLLQRTPLQAKNSPSLGELLKQKAEEGVIVLLLVWDDASNNAGLHSGVMDTHDERTFKYFKHSKVTCVKCPRQGGFEDSYLQGLARANMFTHHQKTVIMDMAIPQSELAATPVNPLTGQRPAKRVTAFLGGLDLTNGRYDTWEHPLYDTCRSGGPHENDYHQACVQGLDTSKSCPREPWHDIHARVDGPVAMDVAINFMERWTKQAGKLNLHKLGKGTGAYKDILFPESLHTFASKKEQLKGQVRGHISLRLEAIKDMEKDLALTGLEPGDTWSVQLFRSIDSDSAQGFPTSREGSYDAGLTVGKGKAVDASIHRAYINLIRKAERYLYLENQYFLGSAQLWDTDSSTPCYNQVPAEITMKIISKIKAGEPFRAYIVIPMYPEGIPTSGSVQAILYYQSMTRQMMYKRVAAAIAEAGLTGQVHPTDYLQFFCLGKREGPGEGCTVPGGQPVSVGAGEIPLGLEELAEKRSSGNNGPAPATNGAAVDSTTNATSDAAPNTSGGTAQSRADAARRFMIYVHSKMMIVDDEYIIVGSANINQRSLDGSRDSEIAIGALQPGHTLQDNPGGPLPRGQVAGFRKALWREHLGSVMPEVDDPSSLECMKTLHQLGNENWGVFVGPEMTPLPHGHLMTYPDWVDSSGEVSALPDCEEFPDLGGKIMGTKSTVLPPMLTT